MKSIGYIIPYFGRLPDSIELWLLSCKMNPTIDWILLTDDKTEYDYPKNVSVIYTTYDDIKKRISDFYDFPVDINKPWKLCAYKPAYGEIFEKELEGYDFWGHCDMDLVWGDIRQFITDDILERYDKIGFQGHSTLFRNTKENNARYRTIIDGITTYKQAFQSENGLGFDEDVMQELYNAIQIESYDNIIFAHLSPYSNSFYLGHIPKSEDYKNHRQMIVWENGKIFRYYVHNGKLEKEEFMYFHTFMRPIKYKIDKYDTNCIYASYPDVIRRIEEKDITAEFVNRHGKCSAVIYYLRLAYKYRKKLTFKKVYNGLKEKLKRKLSK